jgi:multiple sugar transport system ATP-binding protein
MTLDVTDLDALERAVAEVVVPVDGAGVAPGEPLALGVRPEHLRIAPEGPLGGEVLVVERLGGVTLLILRDRGGEEVMVQTGGTSPVRLHERLALGFALEDAHLFRADGAALPHLAPPPLPET